MLWVSGHLNGAMSALEDEKFSLPLPFAGGGGRG